MGASTFIITQKGKNPQNAFSLAVSEARNLYGNEGYTGSIAEKGSFIMIDLPENKIAQDYANELIDNDDSRIVSKWGPAGCIDLGNNEYMFFGWASD